MKIVQNSNSIILHIDNFILACSNVIFPLYEGFSMTRKVQNCTGRKIRKLEGGNEELRFWKDTFFLKEVLIFCYDFNKDILQYPLQFPV